MDTELIVTEKLSPEAEQLLVKLTEAIAKTTTTTTTTNTTLNSKKKSVSKISFALKSVVANIKSNENKTNAYVQNLSNRAQACINKVNSWYQIMVQTLGRYAEIIRDKACNIGTNIAKAKSFTVKKVSSGVQEILKWYRDVKNEQTRVSQVIASNNNQNGGYNKVKFGENYWVQCDNPFYSERLSEAQGQIKKTAKATLLLVVTFIVVTILTNALRTFFGGTAGGAFTSPANRVAFIFFSRVVLTPFIEEPAKLISIKGGYGKHFFVAFNMVEFGLYTMMLMGLGVSLTPIILFRGLGVMMHALTTRIQANSSGTTFSRAWRLAISIIIHFIFNAIFVKFMLFGAPSNALLLFAIGFFGVAFGLFATVKKKSNNEFTTVGNTEQG